MWNAFTLWSDTLATWSALAQTASKMGAMTQDSAYVIDRRTRLMADAWRDPMAGDYTELSRMVPEKVDAFSKAGLAGLQAMGAAQADQVALWQMTVRLAARGHWMSPADALLLARQSARVSKRAAGASGRMIAPLYKGATANARRLRKQKPS